jgi:hypothetical protein
VSEHSLSVSVGNRSTAVLWVTFGSLSCLVWFLPLNPLHTPPGHTFHEDTSDIRTLHTPRNQSAPVYLPSRSISHWTSLDAQVLPPWEFAPKICNISRFVCAFCIQCVSFFLTYYVSHCRLKSAKSETPALEFSKCHLQGVKSETLAIRLSPEESQIWHSSSIIFTTSPADCRILAS